MDNYRILFDKKEYDLIIKLTKTSSDPNDLFYCLTAYVASNRLLDALSLINEKQEILKANLYSLINTHIEILCLLERYDEAYDTAKYYENLPYDSQRVEELLKELPKRIRKYEMDSFRKHQQEVPSIKKDLNSEFGSTVLVALDAIRDRDLSPYMNDLENILVNFPKQSIRSFCLLLLVHQKINRNFKYLNYLGVIVDINPSTLNPPFMDDDFYILSSKIQEAYKDPSLSENAMQIISSYMIYIYPDNVDIKDPLLIEALKIIASRYLHIEYHSPQEEECASLVEKIDKTLNNF